MALVRVGALAALPPGSMREVRDGLRQAVVCNVDGVVHALDNVCPHRGGPLAQGALHGRMVVCPFHAWEFDCTTGECDFDPSIKVARLEVRVEAGEIFVEL